VKGGADFIPAAHDARFAGVFSWYTRRLLAKNFRAVGVETATFDFANRLGQESRPVVLAMSHSSWWDPLAAFFLRSNLLAGRTGIAPMDAEQLRKFTFFRKVGIFGIDPDSPASMNAMLEYVRTFFAGTERATLAITPQGRFTDVRERVRLRPGAAAVLAKVPGCAAAVLSVEYVFWQDKKPELLMRFEPVPEPASASTASWHRALESTMQSSADALAALAIARDPGKFTDLLRPDGEGAGGRVNPVYDLMLRLRGQSGSIAARRATQRPARGGTA
jgi:1-acyl-sn-glycerol-3-phosphate acyltransferase